MPTPTALRVAESGFRRYRQTWRASLFNSFFNPIMLLLAMGIGLGSLVDRNGGPGGLPYVAWLAPGLLANIAMQTATGESAYPVQAGLRWIKSYDAMLAAPIDVTDIVLGHLAWVIIRTVQVTAAFAVVIAALTDLPISRALLAMGPAILTGAAFIGPVTAYTAKFNNDTALSALFRYVVVPLFLFSGVFFPVSQLPALIQPVAWVTPLWNGVELTRAVALGLPTTFHPLIHVLLILSVGYAGMVMAVRYFRVRLIR